MSVMTLVLLPTLIIISVTQRQGHSFEDTISDYQTRRHEDVNHYESKAPHPKMAHPWPDHFYPLQVAMGAAGDDAEAKLVHRSWTEDQLFRHFNIEVRPHVNSLSN
ncbi:hypothetical protein NC653_040535 [Populus alba x Populus x berolinensis]|uniref:Uncharacterized protein n=1 Tax=Populus alba x Populus x berolinensis TaxID=444605 RepID=A0AAD6L6C4_9ROSI|nr:hypothetical protein NC653_040535 [Populus alba x Populus x berolinensis]